MAFARRKINLLKGSEKGSINRATKNEAKICNMGISPGQLRKECFRL